VWQANDGASSLTNENAMVFVDGPYRSSSAVKSAVASLNAIEIAARGGMYEVSATRPSHLDLQVRTVARCLGG
jgi:hypothetical protein